MSEIKRVLTRGRFWLALLLLSVPGLVLTLSGYLADNQNDSTAIDSEYRVKVESQYGQMLEKAEEARKASVFSDPDSFSYRNIEKTLRDFASFQDLQLKPVKSKAFVLFYSNLAADFCLSIWMLFVVFILLQERMTGLWPMIHALPDGRLPLALRRTAILAGAAMLGVLAIDGFRWLTCNLLYHTFADWAQPVQAIIGFNEITEPVSIGQFALTYALVRTALIFLLGLLLMLLLLVAKIQLAVIGFTILFAVEAHLYYTIEDNSKWLWLRGINLVNLVHPLPLLSNYVNLQVFSKILTLEVFSLLAFLLIGLVLLAVVVFMLACQSPYQLVMKAWKHGRGRIRSQQNHGWRSFRPLWLWAVHQQLFRSFGWLLIPLALLFFGVFYQPANLASSLSDQAASLYFERWAGTIGEAEMAEIEQEAGALESQMRSLQAGESGSDSTRLQYERHLLQSRLDGLKQVQDTISRQQALDHQTIRLVNPIPYRVLWDLKAARWQRETGLIVMAAFLLFTAGLFSADQQGSAAALLHSLPDGRRRLVLSRLGGAIGLVSVFSLCCMLIVILRQFRVSGFPSMLADRLTNLPWFPAACGNLPIWSGLVFFIAVNLIAQTGVLLIALWLGSLKGLGMHQTILVLLVLLISPAIFLINSSYEAGLPTVLAIASAWSTLVCHPRILFVWLVL
ncbi:MAG: hypothetical protein SCM11_08005, partial [Bacillota bacterium]|nr:hypothetical protein [Bacillota bacterium]